MCHCKPLSPPPYLLSPLQLVIHPSKGKSFVSGSTQDGFGHGTHCAGILGAINNGYGVIGVAPGAPILPVKVGDRERGLAP